MISRNLSQTSEVRGAAKRFWHFCTIVLAYKKAKFLTPKGEGMADCPLATLLHRPMLSRVTLCNWWLFNPWLQLIMNKTFTFTYRPTRLRADKQTHFVFYFAQTTTNHAIFYWDFAIANGGRHANHNEYCALVKQLPRFIESCFVKSRFAESLVAEFQCQNSNLKNPISPNHISPYPY